MLAGATDWVLDKVIGTEPAAARRNENPLKETKKEYKKKTGPDMGSLLENSIRVLFYSKLNGIKSTETLRVINIKLSLWSNPKTTTLE